MINKMKAFITEKNLIEKGDKIVIGVSGGADSSALLHALNAIKKEFNLTLVVVHIHHMLRGTEADLDAEYVKEFARNLGLSHYEYKFNLIDEAKVLKMSQEEAGRYLRYKAFYEVLKKEDANKIAIAHNMNDSVETMIFNLIRGASLSGLTGIKEKNDIIIRPLINIKRSEIEKYCSMNNIKYRIDSTNKDNIYTRNKIRNELIPLIEENINKKFIENVSNTIEMLKDDDMFLSEYSANLYYKCIISKNSNRIELDVKVLKGLKRSVLSRIVRNAIIDINEGKTKNIYSYYINDVISLLDKQSGRMINLPGGVIAIREFDKIIIEYEEEDNNSKLIINVDKEGQYKFGSQSINFSFININDYEVLKNMIKENNAKVKYFDYDKIKGAILIRTRREKDIINISRDGKRKKIKDLFIDEKVNKKDRENLALVVEKKENEEVVMWAVGIKWNPVYGLSEKTKKVLKIELT